MKRKVKEKMTDLDDFPRSKPNLNHMSRSVILFRHHFRYHQGQYFYHQCKYAHCDGSVNLVRNAWWQKYWTWRLKNIVPVCSCNHLNPLASPVEPIFPYISPYIRTFCWKWWKKGGLNHSVIAGVQVSRGEAGRRRTGNGLSGEHGCSWGRGTAVRIR